MHMTRNHAYPHGYRGFESLPLRHAGVIQWQNRSFPCFLRGFDSLRPLHFFFGNYILNFFLLFLLHCHLECLSVCGQYRPNRAPNPESAVGSRVRPARQSRDCLRGRPLRTPVLSAMVCSAYGVGTAHPCTGAYGVTRRIPALPEPFLSA